MSPSAIPLRLTALLALLASTACGISIGDPGVRGSGHRITQTRTAGEFDRVHVSGDFDVRITAGASPSLRIEGDDDLLPLVETRIVNEELRVRSERNLRPTRRILVQIGTPSLAGVETSGSSDVSATGVRTDAFDAGVSGSGSLDAEGSFGNLAVSVSGSGQVIGRGVAETVDVHVSGSGDVDLLAVSARSARVSTTGSGDVSLAVSESLDASTSGSGEVRYSGRPSVNANVSGSGEVKRL
ncbi:MAG: head GIN domain-containing protein [Gemmatimonadota bacterium]